MAIPAVPLMVEILPTPDEIAHGRCADCKSPLGIMHGRAFRGISSDGEFLVQALCLACAKREQQVVAEGKHLPAMPIYRRRRANILITIAMASFVLSAASGVLLLLGLDIPLPVLLANGPLCLLALPGFYYYGQGVTRLRLVEVPNEHQ